MDTHDEVVVDYIEELSKELGLKFTFQNNYVFLGVPYGTKEYINEYMKGKMETLWIKLQHILLIKNSFIKHNLLRKFFGFNKIIYWLKTVPKYEEWQLILDRLYNVISNNALNGIQMTKTLFHQMSLSQKCGGFGLRNPRSYSFAAEITTLRDKDEMVKQYFPFAYSSINFKELDSIVQEITELTTKIGIADLIERGRILKIKPSDIQTLEKNIDNGTHLYIKDKEKLYQYLDQFEFLRNQFNEKNLFIARDATIDRYNEILDGANMEHNQLLQDKIDNFNAVVGPNYGFKPKEHTSHNKLLNVMDRKYMELFKKEADLYDLGSFSKN